MLALVCLLVGEVLGLVGLAFLSWPIALVVAGAQLVAVGLLRRDDNSEEASE